jgi:hypothetical protein
MIVFRLVKWVDIAEVGVSVISRMVRDNIKHDPDVFTVSSLYKTFKLICCSEMFVDLFPVESSITMVVRLGIMRNRRNPDSIKTHSLNVVKFCLDTCECTAAVLG